MFLNQPTEKIVQKYVLLLVVIIPGEELIVQILYHTFVKLIWCVQKDGLDFRIPAINWRNGNPLILNGLMIHALCLMILTLQCPILMKKLNSFQILSMQKQ